MKNNGPPHALHVQASPVPATDPYGLWGRAFRPFFLGLSVHAAVAVPGWALVWLGAVPAPAWLAPMWWHGHEMVFGFAAAAIAGFLLTASPVWTGGPALTGRPLAALFALWLSSRLLFAQAGVVSPGWLAAVDVPFLPAVAIAMARTLWGSGQRRNYAVLGVVGVLALANAAMHAEALGLVAGVAGRALRFAVDFVVVLLLVIGGRITPAFTRNAFARSGIDRVVRTVPWLDALTIALAVGVALADAILGRGRVAGVLALAAGASAAARLAGWQGLQTRFDPLLWSLHAGMAWIVIGLWLVGASDLGAPVPPSAGLHALTAGAIGSSILAVVTRVSLGHTGRPLVLPRGVVSAYALVHLAAGFRVTSAFVAGSGHQTLLWFAALAWSAAFAIFALRYAPILTTRRPDGRPG